MSPARLRIAATLLWRHLKPALLDPQQLPGLLARLYGIWRERGIGGALGHHAPPGFLYGDYGDWLKKFDTPSAALSTAHANAVVRQYPLLSILALHDETRPEQSRLLLADLLAQSMGDWELLMGTAGPDIGFAINDKRVRVITLPPSTADKRLNKLSAEAKGAFIFHASGVRLHQHAASWIARQANSISAGNAPALVYWDHDEIGPDGTRGSPDFKPDWNPALLRSRNYIDGMFAIASEALRAAGGYSEADMLSRDWDLALRGSEVATSHPTGAERIQHIALVLTHRNSKDGPVNPPRADEIIIDIVSRHLQRIGRKAFVSAMSGMVHVQYHLPTLPPRVSIIIPTRDGLHLLKQAVESVLGKTVYPSYEIIIVDNQSEKPETISYFDELMRKGLATVVPFDHPFNYSAINNEAARRASGSILCFMNNDIEIINSHWMSEMAGEALQDDAGVIGTMLHFPNGTIQHAGVVLGIGGHARHIFASQPPPDPSQLNSVGWRTRATQNYSAVTAACIMMRKSVFDEVKGFDESFAVSMNDIDLCLRVQKIGYRNVWTPHAEMIHHESASRGHDYTSAKYLRAKGESDRFAERWGRFLQFDPAYNPNLALDRAPFMLAWPPRSPGHDVRYSG